MEQSVVTRHEDRTEIKVFAHPTVEDSIIIRKNPYMGWIAEINLTSGAHLTQYTLDVVIEALQAAKVELDFRIHGQRLPNLKPKGLSLPKNSQITVSHPTLGNIFGFVDSAVNWGTEEKPDWYIEFHDRPHNPYYWKQGQDGGTLTIHWIAEEEQT